MNESYKSDPPKNADKILAVQRYLATGMNRNETAAKLGYSGWRSLDIFMRRSGMRWNGSLNRYLSEDEAVSVRVNETADSTSTVSRIIMLFNDINADPKQIAKQTGFADHLKMASYMSARGYTWSTGLNNYVRTSDINTQDMRTPDMRTPASDTQDMRSQNAKTQDMNIADIRTQDMRTPDMRTPDIRTTHSRTPDLRNPDLREKAADSKMQDSEAEEKLSNIDRYIHLLDLLSKHKERLLELLIPEAYGRTIPRYFVPGITRTKSFYMSDSLSRLLNEFCRSRNLSQKEVIEAALIEFLSKYSFKKEVDDLIRGD